MKKRFAFTLAEVTTVLALIGIIAAITIPSLSYNHRRTQNKVRVKKAAATFESVLQRVASENFIKSNAKLKTEIGNTCGNINSYLKTFNRNNCTFKTSDGAWWDISFDNRNNIWARVDVTKSAHNNAAQRTDKTASYDDSAWFFATFVSSEIGGASIPSLHVNDEDAAKAIDNVNANNDCGNGDACKALTNLNKFLD